MSLPNLLDVLPEHPAVTWVPFHISHAQVLKVRAQNFAAISKAVPVMDMLATQARLGVAVTALLHGVPAAVFGSVHLWEGVEEMWMLCEERARKYAITMTRAGKLFVNYRVIAGNLHRAQITVRSSDKQALAWGKALGFETEAELLKYGPDAENFVLMRKV